MSLIPEIMWSYWIKPMTRRYKNKRNVMTQRYKTMQRLKTLEMLMSEVGGW